MFILFEECVGTQSPLVENTTCAIPGCTDQVNKDGAICEWMHPDFQDNYEHRHQSHIYPVFPGNDVTEESNPEIYEACRVAIEKRLVIGLQSQTGWSMAHMANVYARLGDGKRAMDALNILSSNFVGENLFTYHDGLRDVGVKTRTIAPFQIDANCGIPAAVMEMVCGSTSDMLCILPACRPRGRLVSSMACLRAPVPALLALGYGKEND